MVRDKDLDLRHPPFMVHGRADTPEDRRCKAGVWTLSCMFHLLKKKKKKKKKTSPIKTDTNGPIY